MPRRNYAILFVGKRFTGKTTQAIAFAEKSGKRIIVVNTDRHPAYADYKEITPEELKAWKGKKCVVYCQDQADADKVADTLNKYQANAFLVFEDSQKYVGQDVSKEFQRLIINHRMRNFDILFMYHALKLVPPKVAMNYEMLFLFKTSDGKVNLGGKYPNWDYIETRRTVINQHPNIHYCEVIQENEGY